MPESEPAPPRRATATRRWRWVARMVGLVAGVYLLIWVGCFALSLPSMCGNRIIAQYVAPDARRKVVVFERDCGATTGFSTQASLLAGDAALANVGGNLFAADTDHGTAPSGPGGGPALGVRWEGSGALVLTRDPAARVFFVLEQLDGVRVRYLLVTGGRG